METNQNISRYKVYHLHLFNALEFTQIKHSVTMNCFYLTFLVLIAVFPQAKGFCGKRKETKCHFILLQCVGYKGSFLTYDKMPCLEFNGTELTCSNPAFAFPISALAKQVVDSLICYKKRRNYITKCYTSSGFLSNVVNYDRFSSLRQWKLFVFVTVEAKFLQ